MIKEVCKSLNVEHIERENKKKNVMVSNVAEAPSGLSGEQRKEHDIKYLTDELGMDRKNITTCFRAGAMKKYSKGNFMPRPVIVVFKKEETTTYWHNDGKGFKSKSHWINPDLCKADREAQFFVREERRKRQSQMQQKQGTRWSTIQNPI